MKTTILIIIATLGLLIPLLWISGTAISIPYIFRKRAVKNPTTGTISFHPDLGHTMADGGDSLSKREHNQEI